MSNKLLEKGDRTSLIEISCSSDLIKQGNIINLIDGNINDTTTWFNANLESAWIKFKFPKRVRVEKIIWYQHMLSSNGIWTLYGSNNDINYALVQNNINLGKDAISEFNINNNKSYIFYKLVLTNGTTYNGPYTQEIEFKLSSPHYAINTSRFSYSLSEDNESIVVIDINTINENNFTDLLSITPKLFDLISDENYNIIRSEQQ